VLRKEGFTAATNRLIVRLGLSGGVTGCRLSIELWEIEVKFMAKKEKDEASYMEVLYGEE
jgi:hypothetical protein